MEDQYKWLNVAKTTDNIGYTPIRDEVFNDFMPIIGPHGFCLYYFLVREARKNKKGAIRLGLRVIAEQTGLSYGNVAACIKRLERSGLVAIRRGDFKTKEANIYVPRSPTSKKNETRSMLKDVDDALKK